MIPIQWVYLIACTPLALFWLLFFILRKDLRKEMLFTGVLIGLVSVATAYYWWTIDWWHPATITGTRVGIEDFVMGFFSGGIMATAYEFFLRKRLYKIKARARHVGGLTLLLFMAWLTSWLFWGVGVSSFYASSMALTATAAVLYWERRDLIIDGLMSGIFMVLISTGFYLFILFLSPEWIHRTYDWHTLSGVLVGGVPVEEYVFWFLAGVLFGPFYEYVKSDGVRHFARRSAK